MTVTKIGNSFQEIYTKDFLQRMKDENQIFNLEPKSKEELKKYSNKVLGINILKNNNRHYLSLGIEELTKIIKIAKKTVFDMINTRKLDSVKIGKYRLIIFCIEDYCQYKVKDVQEIIKLSPRDIRYKLACAFDRTSILQAILYKYK